MSDVFERFIDHWMRSGVALRPPASETEIVETFSTLGFPVTDDVRRLYSLANGFVDWDSGSGFWWWSLERIRKENQHPQRDKHYLWFADLLICSHLYCLGASDESCSSVWVDREHPWNTTHAFGFLNSLREAANRLVWRIRYGPLDSPRFEKKAESIAEFVENLLQSPDDVDVYLIS